jgi:hypothetical protein
LPETESYARINSQSINFSWRTSMTMVGKSLAKSSAAGRLQRASEAARATLSKRLAGEQDVEKPVQLSWGSAMRR